MEYSSTRTSPIAPAIRPARSWSAPRVAETLSTLDTSNVSGRAPYLSTLARSLADFCVNDPEICAFPPGISAVSYTHLRAHETDSYLVCRLLLEKKKNITY